MIGKIIIATIVVGTIVYLFLAPKCDLPIQFISAEDLQRCLNK
jgi:hypothetical protein